MTSDNIKLDDTTATVDHSRVHTSPADGPSAAATKAAPPKTPTKTSTSTKTKTAIAAALEKAEAKSEAADPFGAADFLSVGSSTASKTEEDVVSANVSMPPTLEFLEDVKGTANGSCFTISIYGEGCLECASLLPSLQQQGEVAEEPVCHFRFGNIHCPAAYHRIQIVGVRLSALARVKKAQASGDGNRMLRQLSKLEELSLDDKNFVLKEIGLLAG